jgi:hypothetical protein
MKWWNEAAVIGQCAGGVNPRLKHRAGAFGKQYFFVDLQP